MESIKLNLIPNGVSPACHCSQYDNGRVIRLELFDGLTPYTIRSGDTFTLNVRKPDNTIIDSSAPISATQGNTYVDLTTTTQICAVTGLNLCDLKITNGSTEIGTLNFIMVVERDVLADGDPSESVIEDLDALVIEAVGDNYYTKEETDEQISDAIKDVYPLGEASGEIASFEDGVILPLKSCICEINPEQAGSGDPSPSNVRSISGHTGINILVTSSNLIDPNTCIRGIYNNAIFMYSPQWITSGYIPIKNNSITLTGIQKGSEALFIVRLVCFDANFNYIGIQTNLHVSDTGNFIVRPTLFTDTKYIRVCFGFDNKNTTIIDFFDNCDLQIDDGNTQGGFKGYGINTNITFGSVGTVFGGTLDVTKGILTLNKGYYNANGSETYSMGTTSAFRFFDTTSGYALNVNTWETDIQSNIFSKQGQAYPYCQIGGDKKARFVFDINDTSITTVGELQSLLSNKNAQVVYPLATPVIYQLTPTEIRTLLNQNNIFHDCNGIIDVIYHHALTAKYIYFDNSGTDMVSTNVEDAIKELLSRI